MVSETLNLAEGAALLGLHKKTLAARESGHRNFDAKPRAYEFVSGCLGSFPDIHERLLSAIRGHG